MITQRTVDELFAFPNEFDNESIFARFYFLRDKNWNVILTFKYHLKISPSVCTSGEALTFVYVQEIRRLRAGVSHILMYNLMMEKKKQTESKT